MVSNGSTSVSFRFAYRHPAESSDQGWGEDDEWQRKNPHLKITFPRSMVLLIL